MTAVLLSFVVGVLGIDRFYLGHTGLGVGNINDSNGLPLRRN